MDTNPKRKRGFQAVPRLRFGLVWLVSHAKGNTNAPGCVLTFSPSCINTKGKFAAQVEARLRLRGHGGRVNGVFE
jgi:hypothetical protein